MSAGSTPGKLWEREVSEQDRVLSSRRVLTRLQQGQCLASCGRKEKEDEEAREAISQLVWRLRPGQTRRNAVISQLARR